MKVALYARVSTDKQTVDNQLIRLREFAKAHDYEITGEYTDVISGASAHRPSLDQLLKDAKFKKFDIVLAVKLDRLGRSVINLQNVLKELDSYGVRIKMLDQDIDTTTSSGRLMFTLLGAMAEFERDVITERIHDGIERAQKIGTKSGKPIGRESKQLSEYQIEKARKLIEENPNISANKLSSNFVGISRNTLISKLTELGIWKKKVVKKVGGPERGKSI